MTEQTSQQRSQKDILRLFVGKSIVVLLALVPIVFYFIVIFPWSSGRSYSEEIFYLEHYVTQDPNDTQALLDRWNRQFFVVEVDEELFRGGAFDRVLILITPSNRETTLNIDYIGSDFHSDILSHYRGTNEFYLSNTCYDIYDWGVFKDGNEYVIGIHLERNWVTTSIYFVLAVAIGAAIYVWGTIAVMIFLKRFKKKKEK